MVSRKAVFVLSLGLFLLMFITGCGNAVPGDEAGSSPVWRIKKMAVDDTFSFIEAHDRSQEDLENKMSPSEVFLHNMIDLVAGDGQTFFTLSLSQVEMLDGPHWTTSLSRVNTEERLIDYAIDATAALLFNGIDFAHHINLNYEKGVLEFYHVDSREMANGLIFSQLIRSRWSAGQGAESFLDFQGRDIIWSLESTRHPFLSYFGDGILINFVDDNDYVLGYLNKNGGGTHFTEVIRRPFSIDDHGMMTGHIPVYAAGSKDGIYFQMILLEGGRKDFDGLSAIYFYCFQEQVYSRLLDLSDNITYLNASHDVFVYNYHSVDNPNSFTGRILSPHGDHPVEIPKITPVNSIVSSEISGNNVYIVSIDHIFVYDLESGLFTYFDIRDLSPKERSRVSVDNGNFSWISFDEDNQVHFYTLSLR